MLKKQLEKLALIADKIIIGAASLLAFTLVSYGAYVVYDQIYVSQNAYTSEDIMRYKSLIETSDHRLGFQEIRKLNSDVQGWLTVYDTNIDYPVLQGSDNLYYSHTDVYGNPSLTGAIYLAYENSPDFSDPYNIIYGHHMENGAMFGNVGDYENADYFNAHRPALLLTPNGNYRLDIFACVHTDAYDSKIYNIGGQSDNNFNDFLAYVQSKSSSYAAPAGNITKLIALSTCADYTTGGRTVLIAKAVRISGSSGGGDGSGGGGGGSGGSDGGGGSGQGPSTAPNPSETGESGTAVPGTVPPAGSRPAAGPSGEPEQTRPEYQEETDPDEGGQEPSGEGQTYEENAGQESAGDGSDGAGTLPGGSGTEGSDGEVKGANRGLLDRLFTFMDGDNDFLPEGGHWALLNLICLIFTFLVLVPIGNVRRKYRQINYTKRARKDLEEMEELDPLWFELVAEELIEQLDEMLDDLDHFLAKLRTGIVLEVITHLAAVILFILTEDIRLPMVLRDKYTPVHILIALAALTVDFICFRYRGIVPPDKEKAEKDSRDPENAERKGRRTI